LHLITDHLPVRSPPEQERTSQDQRDEYEDEESIQPDEASVSSGFPLHGRCYALCFRRIV
jgi:hypothetical protein